MRSVGNPRQRFESHYVDWLGEPPPLRLEVHEETRTGTVLSKNDSPDIPFSYSVNPYRGCTHACAYCYARPSHEYLGFGAGTDFETRIVVKLKVAERLRAELASPRWSGERIAFSGNTDCYQPLEAHYRLTRACLEACRDAHTPVGLVTKSHLVLRDLDVLADLERGPGASVVVSIPFADDALARKIEPGAPRPTKRFEAIRGLAEAGIPVGLLLAPVLPGLNEDAIPEILERAREAGATFAHHQLLRLPPPVDEVFLERVRAALPLRADRVEARVRELRGGRLTESRFGHRHRGRGPYWDAVDGLFRLHARKLGLDGASVGGPERPRPPRPGTQGELFADEPGG